jgi:hypothetical protein
MSKFFKVSIFASILAIAVVFAFGASSVQAAGHDTFDLYVRHNINGRSLGLEKELPVDIYVYKGESQELLATFSGVEFGQSLSAELEADTYYIEVTFAGGSDPIMTLGPVEIPAGVNVAIRATLGAGKAPTLRAVIN